MDFPVLWASPCWHRNGLSFTDSVLAYDHHETSGWRRGQADLGTVRTKYKHNAASAGYAAGV